MTTETNCHLKAAATRWGRVVMPDEAVLEAFRLRLGGQSAKQIAERIHVHPSYVAQVLRGEVRRTAYPDHPARTACVKAMQAQERVRRAHVHRVQARYDRAIRDYLRGLSLRAAAVKHGVHFASLGREMRRRKIPRRKPCAAAPVGYPAKATGVPNPPNPIG